jgi:hypothetical protein
MVGSTWTNTSESGGIGCLLATGVIAAATPEVRHYRRGDDGH